MKRGMYMSYQERLRRYEMEKRELQNMDLSPRQYEILIRQLADKWKI